MVIGNTAARPQALSALQALGFNCSESDDPYLGMIELCKSPQGYRAVIFCLGSIYREELAMVESIKRRFAHLDIWLTQTDGRQAVMAEAMRLGADGFLAEDGLHRVGMAAPPMPEPREQRAEPMFAPEPKSMQPEPEPASFDHDHGMGGSEPVLTADELRALLQEQPSLPPSNAE